MRSYGIVFTMPLLHHRIRRALQLIFTGEIEVSMTLEMMEQTVAKFKNLSDIKKVL